MFTNMENWAEIRRRVLVDGQSKRPSAASSTSTGTRFRRSWAIPSPGIPTIRSQARPKLEPFLPVIHQILKDDTQGPQEATPHRQTDLRATPRRVRLRGQADHRQGGRAAWRRSHAEVFVPLAHRPGEAQVDFGQAEIISTARRPPWRCSS